MESRVITWCEDTLCGKVREGLFEERTVLRFKFQKLEMLRIYVGGFPGGAVIGSLPADAGDTGSCPGPGRSHMPWSG